MHIFKIFGVQFCTIYMKIIVFPRLSFWWEALATRVLLRSGSRITTLARLHRTTHKEPATDKHLCRGSNCDHLGTARGLPHTFCGEPGFTHPWIQPRSRSADIRCQLNKEYGFQPLEHNQGLSLDSQGLISTSTPHIRLAHVDLWGIWQGLRVTNIDTLSSRTACSDSRRITESSSLSSHSTSTIS